MQTGKLYFIAQVRIHELDSGEKGLSGFIRETSSMGSRIFKQLIASFGALLLIHQTGLIDGWLSPNMARLTDANSTIHLTLSEASWLVSFLKVGRFASVILVPLVIELAGSKNALIYAFIPVGVSWLLTMSTTSLINLYAARFLGGITLGLAFGIYSIYLGEISTPSLRGTLNSVTTAGWSLGTVMSAVSETKLPQVVSCVMYLVPCLVGICLFAWLRDSPYQLVKNKDLQGARESLDWYRGHSNNESEMNEIVEYIESTNKETLTEKMKQLKSTPIFKAVLLVALLFAYPQLCGVMNITYYMQIILTSGKSSLVDPGDMVIYVNVILFFGTLVTANVMDKFGRRIVLVISNAIITIALFGLGLHFYLLENTTVDPVRIQVIPVVSLVVLLGAYYIGFSPATSTLFGEIFPAGVKTSVATIVTGVAALSGFAATKSYQPLIDAMGEACVFWIYAMISALAIPVVLILLPETKCKSLQEIQNVLNGK